MSSAEVRPQDFIQIIGTVASNSDGRRLAWKFFDKNFKKIVKRYSDFLKTIKRSFSLIFSLNACSEWYPHKGWLVIGAGKFLAAE